MLEICRVPIKAKHLVHTTESFPFAPTLETSASADALPVCAEKVLSGFASWKDDLNISKQHSKSA